MRAVCGFILVDKLHAHDHKKQNQCQNLQTTGARVTKTGLSVARVRAGCLTQISNGKQNAHKHAYVYVHV